MNADSFLVKKMNTDRFLVKLRDVEFCVFDDHQSLTPHFVHKELMGQTPFPLVDPKVIMDVGANVGMWSFWMSRLYPNAQFLAIEPLEANMTHLQMGITFNKFENIKGFRVALSNKREMITLGLDPTNSGGSSRHNPTTMGGATVQALPLSEVIDEMGPVDLLKLDIEGDEFTLFDGFTGWDKIGGLLIELHPWLLTNDEPSQFKLVEDYIDMVQTNMRGKPVEIQSSNEKFVRKP